MEMRPITQRAQPCRLCHMTTKLCNSMSSSRADECPSSLLFYFEAPGFAFARSSFTVFDDYFPIVSLTGLQP